jgi:polyhydroxybutyrate depolymerase
MLLASGACASDDDGSSAPAPATTQPATTEPATTEPATTEPATTEPATTEPATTEPATTEPATTEPATTEPATCADRVGGVNEVTLTAGGADHPVRVFVPSAFAGEPLPTVLNWHGLGSTGPEQAVYTGYEDLAEAEGFIVVHPTGVPGSGDTRNSWELADFQDPNRDDVAFANALIDMVVDEWCADASRVYSTGMSNGGFFTARLVCEVADRIAAASSIAGTYHPDDCTPARSVPYLAFHGTDDLVVPFDGGGESVLLTDDDPVLRAFFEQVMPDEFAEFAADAGCTLDPTETDVGDEVIRYDYPDCDGGVPLAFFEVTGGGHTWPSSPLAEAQEGALGYTTADVDATADSWAFFQQHALDS